MPLPSIDAQSFVDGYEMVSWIASEDIETNRH
jgi:hypothetical protein